jgi:prophage maintenance system killer protein
VWSGITITQVDEAEEVILAVAAHEVDAAWFANWLRLRPVRLPNESQPALRIEEE